jgi:hypothetical protein
MTQDMQKLERAAQLFQEIKKEKAQLVKLIGFAEEIVTAQGRFNITIKKIKNPGASRKSRQENRGIDGLTGYQIADGRNGRPNYPEEVNNYFYDAMRYHIGVMSEQSDPGEEDHAGIEFNGSDSVALRVMAAIVSEREALIKSYENEIRELLKA